MRFLCLLVFFFSFHQSLASGCQGADWNVIEQTKLPPTSISMNHFGEPVTSVSIWSETAYVRLSNVGFKGTKLMFHSGPLALSKVDLVELLKAIHAKHPEFEAETERTVSTNHSYDDCEDIPANTVVTRTHYDFKIVLRDGTRVAFWAATSSSYTPLSQSSDRFCQDVLLALKSQI